MKNLLVLGALVPLLFLSCGQELDQNAGDATVLPEDEHIVAGLTWDTGKTFTHDPSIIYEQSAGMYWMFYTADGIGVKYSWDALTWYQGVQVLGSAPSWWRDYVPDKTDFNTWAPEIVYYNGYYWLYYSVSTFGSRVSAIGLLRCSSILAGDWQDWGMVIQSNYSTAYNAIDPGFVWAGAPFLAFGSWSDGIYMVRLSSGTMKPNASPFQIADRDLSSNAIEGPCIWDRGNGYYYLFVSFDTCCAGTSSTYNIRYGRSTSATGTYYDRNGVSLRDGGGSLLVGSSGNMIGPGAADIFTTASGGTAMAFHYYDASNNGMATLCIRDITTVSGWPSF